MGPENNVPSGQKHVLGMEPLASTAANDMQLLTKYHFANPIDTCAMSKNKSRMSSALF